VQSRERVDRWLNDLRAAADYEILDPSLAPAPEAAEGGVY
jgi:hypothetical protein